MNNNYDDNNNNNLNSDFIKFNKNKKVNSRNIFFKTFSLTLILMAIGLYFFTPNIDVQIGDISSDNEFEDEIDYVNKKNVDYRLRWIQLEDNGNQLIDRLRKNDANPSGIEDGESHQKDDEKEHQDSAYNDNSLPMEPKTTTAPNVNHHENSVENEIHLSENTNQHATQVKSTFSKVYIGSYGDINAAIEAQNKLLEANLPVSPFIKKMNNVYVIQVGSFASLNKAQILVNQLAQQGFQARIIEE